MKILVINAGSSSLKYQLVDMDGEKVLAKGLCERIGIDGKISHKTADGRKLEYDVAFPTHKEAFQELVKLLTSGEGKVIDSMSEIAAVGHRAVHGGEKYASSVRITDDVINTMVELSDIAPLHNPPGILGMRACQEVFGKDFPMVAVFDTAFHQTMPEKAYIYSLPYEYYEKYRVRRYGFHGTSHRFVTQRAAQVLGKMPHRLITCHLGNGSSISAVVDGKVIDTSMGFTPLDGFTMGTRSGAIDPSIVDYIAKKENKTPDEMDAILNKKSGFLGISGISSDCRDLHEAADKGNARAKLALDIVEYQVKKYIGAYAAAMGGVDVIVFTGGIGENDKELRAAVLKDMEFMGVKCCEKRNNTRDEAKISTDDSAVEVWVLPTNEEIMIARDTLALVK